MEGSRGRRRRRGEMGGLLYAAGVPPTGLTDLLRETHLSEGIPFHGIESEGEGGGQARKKGAEGMR